jgi:V/A-type H+-transporting ATPase subunit D
MAIKFQYNKTSRQQLEKQLGIRERALPTLQSKETALRVEVKKARNEIEVLDKELEKQIQSYDKMMGMWVEFDPTLLSIKDVQLSKKKIAGVVIPMLDRVDFELKPFSLFNQPKWYLGNGSINFHNYKVRDNSLYFSFCHNIFLVPIIFLFLFFGDGYIAF